MSLLKKILGFGAATTLAVTLATSLTADFRKEKEIKIQCETIYTQLVKENKYNEFEYRKKCTPYFTLLQQEIINLENFEIFALSKSLPVQWEKIAKSGIKDLRTKQPRLSYETNEILKFKQFNWNQLNNKSPKEINLILENKFKHLQNVMIGLIFELELLEQIYIPQLDYKIKDTPSLSDYKSDLENAREMVRGGFGLYSIYLEEISLKYNLWILENPDLSKNLSPEITTYVNQVLAKIYFKPKQQVIDKKTVLEIYDKVSNGEKIEKVFSPELRDNFAQKLPKLK